MCRSRKKTAVLLGLAMSFLFQGCAAEGGLFTDTGSGSRQEIDPEDYLNTDVLTGQQAQTAEDVYHVYTLTKGTFVEEALQQTLSRSYINVPTVRLSLENVTAQFGEYVAEHMQYVDVGDVIATVYTDVDAIGIEEAEIALRRLEERCQAAEVQMEEDLEDILEEKALSYNYYEQQVYDIRYQQRQQDWELEQYRYEKEIREARERLEKLTETGSVYEIKATTAGYVNYTSRYSAGKELENGDYICHILNSSVVYATTESQADQFGYGCEVIFDNKNGNTPGRVVNGGSLALYGNLDEEKAIFMLEFEQDLSELNRMTLNNLVLKGNLKTMENVILVPKQAVEAKDGEYFVTVLREDGTLLRTEFIPGGSNPEEYWVYDGLSEGMQIVYN